VKSWVREAVTKGDQPVLLTDMLSGIQRNHNRTGINSDADSVCKRRFLIVTAAVNTVISVYSNNPSYNKIFPGYQPCQLVKRRKKPTFQG
jgi:hypothetical protein